VLPILERSPYCVLYLCTLQLTRLQHENQLLKARISSSSSGSGDENDAVAVLRSQLEDAQRVKEDRTQDAMAAKRAVSCTYIHHFI
jgi:hypothetical protein